MMHEPELPIRSLQNHFPVVRHFTTQDGLDIPQYLHVQAVEPVLTDASLQNSACSLQRQFAD